MHQSSQTDTADKEDCLHDPVTITFHWLTAIIVVIQFAAAQIWPFFDGTDVQTDIFDVHLTFGILLSVLIVLRLAWRLSYGGKRPIALPAVTRVASTFVHWLLYAMLLIQVAFGYVLGWSSGQPITFAGIPAIPALFVISEDGSHAIGALHEKLAWAIIVLAAIHAAAALFHHYVLHDGVLKSMLGRRPRRT